MITSKKELKFYMKADEIMNEQVFPQTIIKKLLFPSVIKRYLKALRKCEYYHNLKKRSYFQNLVYIFHRVLLYHLGLRTGFEIPMNVIGYGCRIGHCSSLIINGNTRIGNYCALSNNITFADGNPKVIGNQVFIGSNTVVAKCVTIADGCRISACSMVNKDCQIPLQLLGGGTGEED